MSAPLISEDYRREQAALHATGKYGTAGQAQGNVVKQLLKTSGATSLLDYGCGSRQSLLLGLNLDANVTYEGYDPAVPAYSRAPVPAELVTCIDVLEHIEPNMLDAVLDDLTSLCDPYGYFTIHSGPARKVLSDGRNAHLTQQGADWWFPKLMARFQILESRQRVSGLTVLVRSRQSDTVLPVPRLPAETLSLPEPSEDDRGATGAAATAQVLPDANVAALTKAPAAGGGIAVKYKGHRLEYLTPNQGTAWRVQTLFTKEPHTIAWLEAMPEGSVLADIGANVGMYSVFAAVVRGARVFAFEPESQNYALLNANIAANGMSDRITAYPLAASETMRFDKLYLSQFDTGASCHSFADEVGHDLKPRKSAFTQGALALPLDQLIEAGAMPVPDFIKIDVDGIEHKVLEGARSTLARGKVKGVLVELNTHLEEHRKAIDMLHALGFVHDDAQVKSALRREGAFEGVGEFVFRRDEVPAQVDFRRRYDLRPAPTARGRHVLQHVLEQVEHAQVIESPFPYLVVDNVFPQDYYQEILETFPSTDMMEPISETGRVHQDLYHERHVVLFTDEAFARMTLRQQRFWREFASWMYTDQFISFFLYKFHRHVEPRLARILEADGKLALKGDALLVSDCTRYAIGPHTDQARRLVSFLFYLPRDASMKELGTSIYVPNDPAFACWGGEHHDAKVFRVVDTVEFLPNRLLAFPKTERSFHGVEQITRENVDRRLLINNIRLLNKTLY
jgi:FkbM family methyltransferase